MTACDPQRTLTANCGTCGKRQGADAIRLVRSVAADAIALSGGPVGATLIAHLHNDHLVLARAISRTRRRPSNENLS